MISPFDNSLSRPKALTTTQPYDIQSVRRNVFFLAFRQQPPLAFSIHRFSSPIDGRLGGLIRLRSTIELSASGRSLRAEHHGQHTTATSSGCP